MADRDTQLHPSKDTDLDNQDRNRVRQQTAEPYGDEPLAAETRVTHERHFAGQPLETVADREASDEVRAERYERAKVDPDFARQQKIDVPEEDRTDAWENEGGTLLLGDPDDLPVHDEDDSKSTRGRKSAQSPARKGEDA